MRIKIYPILFLSAVAMADSTSLLFFGFQDERPNIPQLKVIPEDLFPDEAKEERQKLYEEFRLLEEKIEQDGLGSLSNQEREQFNRLKNYFLYGKGSVYIQSLDENPIQKTETQVIVENSPEHIGFGGSDGSGGSGGSGGSNEPMVTYPELSDRAFVDMCLNRGPAVPALGTLSSYLRGLGYTKQARELDHFDRCHRFSGSELLRQCERISDGIERGTLEPCLMPYGSGNCVRQMALRLSTSPGSREAVLCEWFGANKDLNEKPFSIVLPNSVFPFDEVTDVAVSRNCQMLNYFYNLNRDAQRVVSKTRDLDAGVDWINHYLRTDLGEFAYPYQRLLTDTARSVAEHWEPSACKTSVLTKLFNALKNTVR